MTDDDALRAYMQQWLAEHKLDMKVEEVYQNLKRQLIANEVVRRFDQADKPPTS